METNPTPSPGITWIIQNWRSGQRPDTRGVLEAHPEWSDSPSVILDLALEEYCLRRDAGEQVPFSTFCDQFPTVRGELRALLDVEQHLPRDESFWPELGEDFLEFHLERQLGEGAAARVYLARQTTLGQRYVALKVSRFGASEAATLGKLQHPHVVPVFSVHFDEQQKLTAVCMPYLGAATLFDVCRAAFQAGRPQRAEVLLEAAGNCAQVGEFVRAEPPAAALLRSGTYVEGIIHLAAELADGLAYTHAHGVLHRDLKPSNVLVTPQGRPMLLDFNLSRDRDLELSRIGGTLPYMPPEQVYATFFLDSQPLGDDPRSDIYALGVILFQLLTNRLPFPAANPARPEEVQRYLFAQTEGAEDVRRSNPDVPAELAALVSECLDLTIKNRPATAAALAARLRALLPPPPLSAPVPALARPASSRRRWAALGGAALLAGASLAAFRSEPREPGAPALVREAKRLCDEGLYVQAQQALQNAHNLRPEMPLDEHLAYCAFNSGESDVAVEHLMRANSKFRERDPDILNNLGYCAFARARFSVARSYFDQALRVADNHPQALLNRALLNLETELDPDGGIGALEKALGNLEAVPGSVHLDAARILSTALTRAQGDRDVLLNRVKYHLGQAAELGVSRPELRIHNLKGHWESPWYVEIVSRATETYDHTRNTSFSYYVPPDRWN